MRAIPVKTTKIDMETGEKTEGMTPFMLLPARADKCQICAVDHIPEWPHTATSLYYQYAFYGANGRWPTWGDACAHCEPEVIEALRGVLAKAGIKWTDPPEGIKPIAHLGAGE